MVYAAYRDYRAWREARIEQARKDGRDAERARWKREIAARGIILPPEVERILYGETDIEQARKEAIQEEHARWKREIAARGITLPPEVERILYGETDADA